MADGFWHNLRLLDTEALLQGRLEAPPGTLTVQAGRIVAVAFGARTGSRSTPQIRTTSSIRSSSIWRSKR